MHIDFITCLLTIAPILLAIVPRAWAGNLATQQTPAFDLRAEKLANCMSVAIEGDLSNSINVDRTDPQTKIFADKVRLFTQKVMPIQNEVWVEAFLSFLNHDKIEIPKSAFESSDGGVMNSGVYHYVDGAKNAHFVKAISTGVYNSLPLETAQWEAKGYGDGNKTHLKVLTKRFMIELRNASLLESVGGSKFYGYGTLKVTGMGEFPYLDMEQVFNENFVTFRRLKSRSKTIPKAFIPQAVESTSHSFLLCAEKGIMPEDADLALSLESGKTRFIDSGQWKTRQDYLEDMGTFTSRDEAVKKYSKDLVAEFVESIQRVVDSQSERSEFYANFLGKLEHSERLSSIDRQNLIQELKLRWPVNPD
jgi:hypothetical protein